MNYLVTMNSNDQRKSPESDGKASWRIRLGTWMFYVPFLMFIGAPLVIPLMGLSAGQSAAIIGGIIVAAEIIWFASIPLLGKTGFKEMKNKAFSVLRLRSDPISRSRHRFGVGLLVISIAVEAIFIIFIIGAHLNLGAESASASMLGFDFQTQAAVFIGLEIATAAGIIVSVYLLGAGFAERLKLAFQWHGDAGQA